MPSVPIDIIQIDASGDARYGIVSGRIEGKIRAGIDVTAEACHGLAIGIEPGVAGNISGQAQVLLVGGSVQGQLTAQAGVKVMARVNPNLFDSLGLTIEAGAYAFAAAAGRLGIYLTPEYFARFIQDHLEELPADLFLIFLEEVRAEVGIWGKIAASAAIEGRINAVLEVDGEDSGLEISGGFNAGWGVGTGWDFYCVAGFTDLRRAVRRSCLRINTEIRDEIREQELPGALVLSSAFDFAFPLSVMMAYDLGVVAKAKGALLTEQDVASVLQRNFTENLQRFTTDTLAECAIKWIASEFRKLWSSLAGTTLSDAETDLLEERINDLLDLLGSGELTPDRLNRALSAAIEIADIVDNGELTRLARPLTTFWLAGMLGLRARQLLDRVGAEISVGSSAVGAAGAGVSLDLLTDPPQIVLDEIHASLGDPVTGVDVGTAVDYLVEVGVSPLLAKYSPEFDDFLRKLEASFGLSGGDVVEDVVRSIAGVGSLSDLNSYEGFKQFVQEDLLRGQVRGELLPLARQLAADHGNTVLAEYIDEVVEPCTNLVADFIFSKLDNILLDDLSSFDDAALMGLTQNLTGGCGVVVYQVLARNVAYFDRVVTDFMLDSVQTGSQEMRLAFQTPEHPFFGHCREVLEANLPGSPDLTGRSESLTLLLLELAMALEEMSGPTVFTPQRRARIHELKGDILLSMAGDLDDGSGGALATLVDHVVDCLHIPHVEKSKELAELLVRIQAECFAIVNQRVAPALADFYLTLTLPELISLRAQLNGWIYDLRTAAENALAAYSELADDIRTEIVEVLDALDEALTQLREDLEAHIQSGWAVQAKAAIRTRAEEAVTENITDPTAKNAALIAFATTEWLIVSPLLDLALVTLSATVSPLLSTLDGFLDGTTDATEQFLAWQEGIETQLLADLQNMVVIPAADTATLILDTVFPPYVITMIEEYLAGRAEQRRLEQEEAEQNAILATLAEDRDAAAAERANHAHRSNLELSIAMPSPDPARVYPASVRLSVVATGLTDAILAEPRSRRVQFRLNGRPLSEESAAWQTLSNGDRLWTWQSADGEEMANGVNLFEVSWIRGTDSTSVERRMAVFVVDRSVFYSDEDFVVQIIADPEGRDVHQENVLIEWNGEAPLELEGWMLRDLANHRYSFPGGVVLLGGQSLRIFTGGDPDQNSISPAEPEKTLYMGRRAAILNNTGDLIELIDANGVVAVSHGYGDFFEQEA